MSAAWLRRVAALGLVCVVACSAAAQTLTVGQPWDDARAALEAADAVQVLSARDPDTRERYDVYRLPNRAAVRIVLTTDAEAARGVAGAAGDAGSDATDLDATGLDATELDALAARALVVAALEAGTVRADPSSGVARFTGTGDRVVAPGGALDLAAVRGPSAGPLPAIVLGAVAAAIVAAYVVGRRRLKRAQADAAPVSMPRVEPPAEP